MLRLLLALSIVLLPNALHVSMDTAIPGLNFSNLLLLVLLGALALSRPETSPTINRAGYLTAPLLAVFLTLTLGFVIAQWTDPSTAMADLTRLKNAIFYPLFYFVFRRSRQDLERTRQLILLVLVVAVAAGVEAIYQGAQFGFGQFVESQRATGPFGPVNMSNRAGAFYAMFLPMLAAVAVMFKRKGVRVAAVVGCVLLATAILFTYSRQSYLIALVGLLILLMHRSFLAAILAGLLLVVSVGLFPDSVVQRVQETRQVDAMGDSGVDSSTASRVEIWTGAIAMWREHPAGVGLGRFSSHIGEYSRHVGKDAHNVFVLMLAECGPLGLLAMLWLFRRLWGLAGRLKSAATPTDIEARALALGFRITVISVLLGNFYGTPFFEGLIMANFWVLCGLLDRYAALKREAAGEEAPVEYAPVAPSLAMADRFPLLARTLPGAGKAARTSGR